MPNTKISNLTTAGALSGTEVLPIVQSGTTKKVSTANVANFNFSQISLIINDTTLGTFSTTILKNNTGATLTISVGAQNNEININSSTPIFTNNKTFIIASNLYYNPVGPIKFVYYPVSQYIDTSNVSLLYFFYDNTPMDFPSQPTASTLPTQVNIFIFS